ncbi:MAG TPA: AAA family ATPase, partial [Leptospiraceae bacterium]|nr:AAA family ATPase [Leptospiraceae bacterium]
MGPTGAGKTELAKAMAEFLFESERYLVRFNMNEYADAESVSRLIGDFKNPEGTLTVQVSRRKACVLLLDEIEKAHPSVHDLLLQVLGEGRLTNSLGAVTDFKYAVIIMTSNIGADKAGKTLGFSDSTEDSSSVYRKAVEDYFRPEFINRIDSITVFEKLKFNDIKKITFIQIRKLLQREGFLRRAVFLRIEKDCFNAAAEQGFDSAMGARALVRSIEKLMTFPIAETLASSKHENPVLLNLFMKEGRISVDVLLLNYLKEVPRKSISVNLKSVNSAEIEKILDSIQELETSLLEDPDREDRNKKFLYWKIT